MKMFGDVKNRIREKRIIVRRKFGRLVEMRRTGLTIIELENKILNLKIIKKLVIKENNFDYMN